MSVFSPLGADVKMASVAPRLGRIACVGQAYWSADVRTGYAGHDGHAVGYSDFQADSRRSVQALVEWLTGKSSGASVLLLVDALTPNAAPGGNFANEFQNGLIANGHSLTATGSPSSWSGFEPLDYDLLCVGLGIGAFSYHGIPDAQGKIDYVLAGGTSILFDGATYAPKYGIRASAGSHGIVYEPATPKFIHSNGWGPPYWQNQRPFSASELGVPPSGGSWGTTYWALVMYTTKGVYPDDANWTMGGTRGFAQCVLEQYGNHSDVDADGLNVVGFWQP